MLFTEGTDGALDVFRIGDFDPGSKDDEAAINRRMTSIRNLVETGQDIGNDDVVFLLEVIDYLSAVVDEGDVN